MWEKIADFLPSKMTVVCAVLAVLIPWIIYSINQKLHEYGDPPWKKEQNDQNES